MSNFQAVAVTLVAPLVIGVMYALLKRRRAKAPALPHVLLASGSLQCQRH
jgi:xanthosine utilization system XapX-like protein